MELLLATGLIHLLGLVGTVFVILVFNYYLPYGIDTTLVTLALGALIAAAAEWGIRAARVNLCAGLSGTPNRVLGEAVFGQLANAQLPLLERLPSASANGFRWRGPCLSADAWCLPMSRPRD